MRDRIIINTVIVMFRNDNFIVIESTLRIKTITILQQKVSQIDHLHAFFVRRCILNTRLVERIEITNLTVVLKHSYRHHCELPRAYLIIWIH